MSVRTDSQIAMSVKMRPIEEIAGLLGISSKHVVNYGRFKAKIKREAMGTGGRGKLVLVSAITPTPAGEGKTTTTIGLADGLRKLGQPACCAIREPSLGPVFGMKGGAAGGGYSQVIPAEDINLHFTGDMHAVGAAHNLLAASIDNHLYWGSPSGLDSRTVNFRRVLDMNDRSLRSVVIGLGGRRQGVPRETGFDITAASEVMAILCLASDLQDLHDRLNRILVGYTGGGDPVLAKDIGVSSAMTLLLKEAVRPNLVQTLEGTPAFVHGGPFANIAHGCSSVIATRMAMSLADWTVTEAGFGFDLGAEKFFDITCPYGGFAPCAVVLVATCRALKMHGGVKRKDLSSPDASAVSRGLPNLEKHVENIRKFRVPAVVCLNRFPEDTPEEMAVVTNRCRELGVPAASGEGFMKGGEGMTGLAREVMDAASCPGAGLKPLYDWSLPVEEKIGIVAREIYGAAHIDFTPQAREDLARVKKHGYAGLPVCIAKTQNSLSDNPDLLGRPKDFVVTVREIVISSGAGFLVPITGDIMRMPGLPRTPAAETMEISADGEVTGLF
jgi:formate--tetrahydrofolate ligase